jgi:membrane protein YdbS with pleckstrin-like domain
MGGENSKMERDMKRNDHPRMRRWMLMVPVGVIMLVAHSVVLYYGLSHKALSATVVSGLIVLIVIKHLGLLGPLYALFHHRPRR